MFTQTYPSTFICTNLKSMPAITKQGRRTPVDAECYSQPWPTQTD